MQKQMKKMSKPQKHKSVNPRSIPKSQADVDRAYEKGKLDAMTIFLNICVFTLGSDMGMSDDDLETFNKRFVKNLECHLMGEMREKDIRDTLLAERGWEVQRD